MNKFKVITFSECKKFLNKQDKINQAKVDNIYYLFEEYGFKLPSKYLKKLNKFVWELRSDKIRLLLNIQGNTGYVVHGFIKKTQKTPKRELELATQRIKKELL